MAERSGIPESPTRRGVVAAAGGVGLAAVLTACGGSDSKSDGAATDSPSAPSTTAGSATTSAAPSPAPTKSAAAGGTPLGKTSDVPVGGGKVYAAQKVVVTQPTAGEFKCFSAVCTHQGCTVAGVSGGTINCPCHGSKFHVADGSVAHGPAASRCPPSRSRSSGGEITLA